MTTKSGLVVMAIDPGFTGAIALYDAARHSLAVTDMPVKDNRQGKTEVDTAALRRVFEAHVVFADAVVIERVSAMGKPRTSDFRFGYGAGVLEGVASGFEIPLIMVPPARWKLGAGIRAAHGMTRDERKAASRDRAVEVFPAYASLFARAKDDGRAEAALLAWWYAHAGCKISALKVEA